MTTKCFICLASCSRYFVIAVINYSTNQRGATQSGIRFPHQPSKQLSYQPHHHHYYAIFIILTFVCLVDERCFRWICSQNTHHPHIFNFHLTRHAPSSSFLNNDRVSMTLFWHANYSIIDITTLPYLRMAGAALLVQCQLCYDSGQYSYREVRIIAWRWRMDGELPPIITIKEISKIQENLL